MLHDSPEEDELVHTMGRIVTALLQAGEKNTQPADHDSSVAGHPVATSESESSAATPGGGTESGLSSTVPEEDQRETGVLNDKMENHNRNKPLDTEVSRTSESKESYKGSVGTVDVEVISKQSSVLQLGASPPPDNSETPGTSPDDLPNPLVLDLANDSKVQEKWYLTFEQFVSGLNQEPELCQFFAEQNKMDLTGSSPVDPVLSSYTRTVLASSPL